MFPTHPSNVLFKINMLMQKWQVLLKGEEKMILETKIKGAREWMENFVKECKSRPAEDSFI